jgi:hypothetical protein
MVLVHAVRQARNLLSQRSGARRERKGIGKLMDKVSVSVRKFPMIIQWDVLSSSFPLARE